MSPVYSSMLIRWLCPLVVAAVLSVPSSANYVSIFNRAVRSLNSFGYDNKVCLTRCLSLAFSLAGVIFVRYPKVMHISAPK